ncbi:hypothetical protein [Kibdelosporangium philippinense]
MTATSSTTSAPATQVEPFTAPPFAVISGAQVQHALRGTRQLLP